MSELLSMDEPRKRFVATMSGLDIHHDLGEGHPLLGRRMPDLDLVTAGGPLRVFTLPHDARPVLINPASPATSLHGRIAFQAMDAKYEGPRELPAIGAVIAPGAVDLVRTACCVADRFSEVAAPRGSTFDGVAETHLAPVVLVRLAPRRRRPAPEHYVGPRWPKEVGAPRGSL